MTPVTDAELLRILNGEQTDPAPSAAPGDRPAATAPIPPLGMGAVTDDAVLKQLRPAASPEHPIPGSIWQRVAQAARQYANDVLTGRYAEQGLQNLTGAYRWNPDISPLENARAAARDPASIAQAANIALALTPAPIAAVRPPPAPTAPELAASGSRGFDAFNNSGIEFQGERIADIANAMKAALAGRYNPVRSPETFSVLDEVARAPKQSGWTTIVTPDGIKALRETLSDIRQSGATGADKSAAGRAIRGLDSVMESANPSITVPGTADSLRLRALADTWKSARGDWAAAQRNNDITGALDRAVTGVGERAELQASAAYSGRNFDNSLRQKALALLKDEDAMSGWTKPEIDALRAFVNGEPLRNFARLWSDRLAGGGGSRQTALAALGAALGGGAGAYYDGYPGGTIGALVGGIAPFAAGGALKSVQNSLARARLNDVGEMLARRSPLYEQMLTNPPLPGLDKQALFLRLLATGGQQMPQMWGTLAPSVPPQP